jgi:hypothetical protein
MSKKRKPTMMEMKNVLNNSLLHMASMQKMINSLDFALTNYIRFNGHSEKWKTWIHQEIEKEKNESRSKESGVSSGRAGTRKTRKEASNK